MDHTPSILFKEIPEVHLVLSIDGTILVLILLLLLIIKQVLLQASQQFFDEAVEDTCSFFVFDTDRVLQYLHKTLQLTAIIEQGRIVPEIPRAKAEKVIDKFFLPLAIGASSKDLDRMRAYKVKSLLEEQLVGRVFAELRQTKFNCVDKRADRIFLIACQCFTDERLQVG